MNQSRSLFVLLTASRLTCFLLSTPSLAHTLSQDYPHKIRKMIDAHNCRLIVSLDDLREQHGELAKGILTDPFININAAELALKEVISTHPDGPSFIKDFDDKVFVGFEGSCGAQHVTPRGLSAGLLGKLVMVEGIVSKC